MKILLSLSIPVFLLSFFSCSLPGDNIVLGPGQFWAQRADNSQWYVVDTVLVHDEVGSKCKIYLEKGRTISAANLNTIVDKFDNSIYSMINTNFGEPSDVDGDGKITIFILDIKDGYVGGGYVAGYFHPINEYSDYHSNEREMLYMDCFPGNPGDSTFNFTMAHEFQHLVNYNQKVFVQGVGQQDLWINEGLSSAAEYLYQGSHITDKINHYNNIANTDIAKGQNFVSWGVRGNILGYYSTVYLFFQWLRIHSSAAIYKDIINNTSRDVEAVRASAEAKIGALTGNTWEDILRDWYAANFFNNSSSIHGYEGEFTLTPYNLGGVSNTEYSLYPGEGIYLNIGGTPADMTPSSRIKYAGLTDTGDLVDTSNTYAGDRLLCFNINGNRFGGAEPTSTLPSIIENKSRDVAALMQKMSPIKSNKPFPIDIVYDLDGRSSLKINNKK